jgi:hypothetical protein
MAELVIRVLRDPTTSCDIKKHDMDIVIRFLLSLSLYCHFKGVLTYSNSCATGHREGTESIKCDAALNCFALTSNFDIPRIYLINERMYK